MNGLTEIWMRWKEPLNTFWRRALIFFATIGGVAATVTDLLPAILHDELVPDEWRPTIRIIYAVSLFGAILSKLTVADTSRFKEKKHNEEFNDKLN